MEWFPAITTTGVLAFALWLGRNLIVTRLTNAVRHEHDVRLKEIEHDLRAADEHMKAELRKKEVELDALRSGALSGVATRQSELYKKQLFAVEAVWAGINKLARAKGVIQSISILKFEAAVKEAARNPELRDTFKTLGSGLDENSIETPDVDNCRPFLTPMAWAYFSAYKAIVGYYYVKQKFLETGIEYTDIIKHDHVKKLIETALPNQAPTLEKYGAEYLHLYFDELESKLLTELNKIIVGESNNQESIKQAADIIKASEELTASTRVEQAG